MKGNVSGCFFLNTAYLYVCNFTSQSASRQLVKLLMEFEET